MVRDLDKHASLTGLMEPDGLLALVQLLYYFICSTQFSIP